jgi:hypothetical protein
LHALSLLLLQSLLGLFLERSISHLSNASIGYKLW